MSWFILSLQTRKKYDKSPTFKIYTTSACILRGRNIFRTPRAVRTTAGLMPLGLFTPPSGRCLVIPIFFIIFLFFLGHLPQTTVFARPDKYSPCFSLHGLGIVSWMTLICFTPQGEGEQWRGLMPLGLFLFNSQMQAFFWQFCFASPTSLGKVV